MSHPLHRFALLLALLPSALTAACSEGQCDTALDCGEDEACQTWVCEQHQCIQQESPAGTLPSNISADAPPCHRLVCDGHGAETLEVDTSASPPQDGVEPCQRATCDADGNVTSKPDPTNLPPNVPGDCRSPACNANGTPSFTPDPADVPQDTIAGDCMKPACDAAGNVTSVAADDPPGGGDTCMSATCQNGMAMSMPANQGKVCSSEGWACSPTGTCDVCPVADAMCTDPGPGADAHTLATAHDFGTIGWCDSDGFGMCDTLTQGTTSFFGYKSDGTGSFCSFDPYVSWQADAPVTLCEYFECPSVTCPAPSTPAQMGGLPGCCATAPASELAISPSCQDSQVFITVQSSNATCTSYTLGFHS